MRKEVGFSSIIPDLVSFFIILSASEICQYFNIIATILLTNHILWLSGTVAAMPGSMPGWLAGDPNSSFAGYVRTFSIISFQDKQ
jgi:hypothetical protein